MSGCRRARCFGVSGVFSVFMTSGAAVGLPGAAIAAPASLPAQVHVQVQVLNHASVPRQVLELAQRDVREIYREIGVDVVWIDAATMSSTSQPLLISIVTVAPPNVSAKVMGVALRDSVTTSGQFAYVFYDRIQGVSRRSRCPAATARILGAVIAHELGHLLLPYGSHSPTGLMRGDWGEQELQGPNFGWLRFTRSQGDLIRQHLAGADELTQASRHD